HYNGETFSFLKKTGFNAVLMQRLPTVKELEQAQQYQIWILCPPILGENELTRPLLTSRNLEMILAWNLGSKLTSNELNQTKQGLSKLRQRKPVIERPTFCHAHFPIDQYEQVVDFQRFIQPVFGTSFSVEEFREFLIKQKPLGKPFWVNIQTQLPGVIQEQASLLRGPRKFDLLSATQIEDLVFQSLFAGARGLVFESNTNLQQSNSQTQWLVPILRVLNRRLIQIDPWIAGGTVSADTVDESLFMSFDLPRSQLTCAMVKEHQKNFRRTPEIELDTNQKAPRVYQVTDTGITPVAHQAKTGKLKITLNPLKGFQRFVISEDALSFRYIQQCTNQFESEGGILRDRFQILDESFNQIQSLLEDVSLGRINRPKTFVSLNEVRDSLERVKSLLANKQTATVQTILDQVDQSLATIKVGVQRELLVSRNFVSSPFNSDFSQLSSFVFLEQILKNANWSGNLLQGADFDSLRVLASSGWKQHLNDSSEVSTHISISEVRPDALKGLPGHKAMQIRTWDANDITRQLEVTPVWITSPKIKLIKNQLVRVEGYLRIARPIEASRDGFMVIDNIGGPDLASRFFVTDSWRYFAIERLVPKDMDFGFVLAQTGL
ncbi:MAG: hypothetical protein VX438_14975, partial [Planctomycetota bacterium]|nr:hypothetical protein [Planctomycetota bacterium]